MDLGLAALRLALPRAMADPLAAARRLTPQRAHQGHLSYHQACQLALLTDRLARMIRPSLPCLPRAILRFRALRRLGEPAAMHIGLSRFQGRLSGHAWVSVNGVPFFEDHRNLALYRTFLQYPEDE